MSTAPSNTIPTIVPPYHYRRRQTRRVLVGDVALGAAEPIRVQSMTTTPTGDSEATALQVQALAEAGCEIVRVTVPNMPDARSLEALRERLEQLGVRVPLVADIHFNPHAALHSADYVEKVRINPGNYADSKRFAVLEYTDDEYTAELDRVREKFSPLVEKCQRLGRAMRIGTNHGSLSDRIMNRFGDTPLGMVESALEFVRICEEHDYRDLVLSMKSSNPFVVVQAYRLLADRMAQEDMDYPFHLGVTEAGDGEDARIKSAVGIGSLLADGIGDTVRVSLTEDPCAEVPVARALVAPFNSLAVEATSAENAHGAAEDPRLLHDYARRATETVPVGHAEHGGESRVQVWLDLGTSDRDELADRVRRHVSPVLADSTLADVVHLRLDTVADLDAVEKVRPALWHQDGRVPLAVTVGTDVSADREAFEQVLAAAACVLLRPRGETVDDWTASLVDAARAAHEAGCTVGACLGTDEVSPEHAALPSTLALARSVRDAVGHVRAATERPPLLALIPDADVSPVHAVRLACAELAAAGVADSPVLLVDRSPEHAPADPLLEGAQRLGGLLADGIGDAIRIDGADPDPALTRAFGILQTTRLRMSRPDYIACPSCGRTLFDLEEVTARIKGVTSHLKGVKIAIMGCIVNGPGEMADADFGYVGSAPGKINLYVKKDCVAKGIPEAEADERLIELIKEHGAWVDPPAGAAGG